MAAGVITLSTGRKFDVESDSCFHAIQALATLRTLNQTGASCSADPVTASRTVTFTYSTNPTTVVHTVSSTTASPMGAMDLGNKAADWYQVPFLLQALLIVFALFFAFKGYDSGLKQ